MSLTVLSFGGGQDSTTLLYLLTEDPEFRKKYAPGDLVVTIADTANEHPATVEHIKEIEKYCKALAIPFFFLSGDKGYTSPTWSKGLIAFYEHNNAVGSKAFPKTCTDKLKITPIYNWLEEYVHNRYNTQAFGRKTALKEYAEKYGKINVIIGIAAGEEKRMSSNEDSKEAWMRIAINKIYPLVDIGWDRQRCQDYIIKELMLHCPPPSNCILCPFMSLQELLYLYLKYPEWYKKWVLLEYNKILANAYNGDITKSMNSKGVIVDNLGVWGKKLLPEMLLIAKEKYGHMTMQDLEEYKFSHGHCVANKF
jgi:3'-phosphoadenosine 5'-phosphosulfate sulfotransferase (PAPS reductase)/FAD synthetase